MTTERRDRIIHAINTTPLVAKSGDLYAINREGLADAILAALDADAGGKRRGLTVILTERDISALNRLTDLFEQQYRGSHSVYRDHRGYYVENDVERLRGILDRTLAGEHPQANE